MAGAIVPVAINQVTEQRKGFQNITLTNWTNTAEPAINQGGRVEIKGALFSFAGNEDLDASNNWAGFGNSTQIYGYYLVGGGGTTVVCELTTTAPTWQEESGGWYDTASDTNRFWGGIYKDGSGNYADKFLYDGRNFIYSDNFIKMTSATDTNILCSNSSTSILKIAEAGGAGTGTFVTTEFTILKPISAIITGYGSNNNWFTYLDIMHTAIPVVGDTHSIIISRNTTSIGEFVLNAVVDNDGGKYLALNPGEYRIRTIIGGGETSFARLYAIGCYGSKNLTDIIG